MGKSWPVRSLKREATRIYTLKGTPARGHGRYFPNKTSSCCSKDLNRLSTANTRLRTYSIHAHSHPLLPLLDLVLVGAASVGDDFFGLSLFSQSIDLTSSDTPLLLAANVALPPLFLESTRPISGISDASHCWKGFATKKPLTSNHRVKGEESSSVFVSPSALEYSTLML